jgi:hypothetical protein
VGQVLQVKNVRRAAELKSTPTEETNLYEELPILSVHH